MKKINIPYTKIAPYLSIFIALLSLIYSYRANKRTQELNDISIITKVDMLLNEAWDILGGMEGCDITFNFVNNKSKIEIANRKIDEAIKFLPNYSKTLLLKGMYFEAIGNYSDACVFYKKAIDQDSTSATNYLNLGNAYFKLEKYTESENAYKKCIYIDKDNVLAYNNLRILSIKNGKIAEAEKARKRVSFIVDYKRINSSDSLTQDTMLQNILNKKLQLGRSFHENTFKTDISHMKYSIKH